MEAAVLTALGVGGATVVGALIGFLFKNPSHKFNDIILSFAAGAMMFAVLRELMPSISSKEGTTLGTVFFAIGFSCMMMLDVALG